MTDEPVRGEFLFMTTTLAATLILMYAGRAVPLYYASQLSAAFGALGVAIGGGDVETTRQVAESVVRAEPALREQVFAYSAVAVLFVNWLNLRTGLITRRLSGE